ncbi:tRNA (guanine-N(7)-)-methyltransferase [Camellia lanceoleosa]|uniref:tRNA (Guanine-N(7)-)-methyltransferase n=1 Tax=Camellia lanceoleosa TaxID=1840588 RepID=A0ACC0HF15_9ERIC|nr:tRNA (guanine-N(7)-)-methyltransferase [Camellia lanceoleosa]
MPENETNPYISKSTRLPRKRFYRARAHSNPLSDSHFPVPISPCHADYFLHFPQLFPSSDQVDNSKKIQFADIGCGFGGLLISLSTLFPDTLMIGMELRDKVTEYVKERILALRVAHPSQYQNVSVVRTNSMKYIPNYFEKGQLSKMFFLFPDPHFKEKNHWRRVISPHLLDEYAYVLGVGGIIYTITDVEELGEWMKACLEGHPLFEALTDEELEADPVMKLLNSATEEGQKVARNGGQTFQAVFRRIVISLEIITPSQKIVVHKESPRGIHFRRAGPRQKVYFDAYEPLSHVWRHQSPRDRLHAFTIIGTSQGGHDTSKIVDSNQDCGINQVYIIGGDGTRKGAAAIFQDITSPI